MSEPVRFRLDPTVDGLELVRRWMAAGDEVGGFLKRLGSHPVEAREGFVRVALDIDPAKVAMINARQSPIEDAEIEDFLAHRALNLTATLDPAQAYEGADFVIVATHERFRAICEAVIAAFDASILAFYDEEDRRTASITSRDRRGQVKVFPVLALSICAVDSRHLDRADSIRVGEIAAELKHYAKTIAGSTLVVDQRAPH